jgi:hypothetical protein
VSRSFSSFTNIFCKVTAASGSEPAFSMYLIPDPSASSSAERLYLDVQKKCPYTSPLHNGPLRSLTRISLSKDPSSPFATKQHAAWPALHVVRRCGRLHGQALQQALLHSPSSLNSPILIEILPPGNAHALGIVLSKTVNS